jgi:hypothetical protein
VKTISLKKVAVVAVASLGFGLTSVVPAKAAVTAATTALFSGTITTVATTSNVLVGATASLPLTLNFTAGAAADNTAVTCTATNRPADSQGVATTPNNATTFTVYAAGTNSVAPTGTANIATVVGTAAGAVVNSFTANYVPSVPGIYRVACVAGTGTGGGGTVVGTAGASLTHTWTINAGYGAVGGTTNINKAFPLAGSNITTGWAATGDGQAAIRIGGFPANNTTRYYINVDKGSLVSLTGTDAAVGFTATTAANFTNGVSLAAGGTWLLNTPTISDSVDVVVTDSGGVATSTVTVTTIAAGTGATSTYVAATVTWGVAAAPSAQYSLLTLNTTTGTVASGAAADTTAVIASSSNSAGAVERYRIQVVARDQYDVAYTGATLGAKIDSTAGSLGISGTTNGGGGVAGSSISAAMTNSAAGSISVFSNGVAGKAVITITATTPAGVSTTLGSKTVTFAGSATKATVTQNLFVAKAGTVLGSTPATTKVAVTGVATSPALTAEVLDSGGNAVVAGAVVKITSSDSTVIVAGTCVELTVDGDPTTVGNQPSPGVFECPVSGAVGAASGKSATITFSVFSSTTGLYSILATPVTYTIGGAIAKSVISLDKASYTAGEAMILLATSTDSSGNAAYDGQTPYTSISSNKSLITLPATTKEIVLGKASTTSSKGVASLFAPATSGSFAITGLYTDAATGTAYTVTGSVGDANAGLLTQIDALNAKIVALNALIAKIMKKLGVK